MRLRPQQAGKAKHPCPLLGVGEVGDPLGCSSARPGRHAKRCATGAQRRNWDPRRPPIPSKRRG
eukprot:3963220-Alexandrium_andersonii.AAC.1